MNNNLFLLFSGTVLCFLYFKNHTGIAIAKIWQFQLKWRRTGICVKRIWTEFRCFLSVFSWTLIFVSLDVDDGVKREYVPVPIPVPVFIPMPMNMYSQVTPTPVSLPVPVGHDYVHGIQIWIKPVWVLTKKLCPGACACISAYYPAGGRRDYWEHQRAKKQRDLWPAACDWKAQRGPERRYSCAAMASSVVKKKNYLFFLHVLELI